MAEIEMYATQTCDYCADARTLFKKKGVTYKCLSGDILNRMSRL
jgi:glutaredoxin